MPAADAEIQSATLMWSTVTAILARIAGLRWVTPVTMQPTRARRTTTAMAASVVRPLQRGLACSTNP